MASSPRELAGKLQAIEARAARQRALRDDLARTHRTLQAEQAGLPALRRARKQRQSAVDALGGLTGIVASLQGNKAERLAVEQQALHQAQRALDDAEARIAAALRQIEFLEQELAGLGPVEKRRKALLDELEQALAGADPALAETCAWLRKVRQTAGRIAECLATGERAQIELTEMLASLKGARRMGMLDMAGGGLVVTALKHARIDKANTTAEQVGELLGRFAEQMDLLQDEFADRFGHIDLASMQVGELKMGGFLKAADYLFDGILADWTAQGRIRTSQLEAESARDKLAEALQALQQTLVEVQGQAGRLMQQRENLLLRAAGVGSAEEPAELLPLEASDVEEAPTREITEVDPIERDPYGEAPTEC